MEKDHKMFRREDDLKFYLSSFEINILMLESNIFYQKMFKTMKYWNMTSNQQVEDDLKMFRLEDDLKFKQF